MVSLEMMGNITVDLVGALLQEGDLKKSKIPFHLKNILGRFFLRF